MVCVKRPNLPTLLTAKIGKICVIFPLLLPLFGNKVKHLRMQFSKRFFPHLYDITKVSLPYSPRGGGLKNNYQRNQKVMSY